MKKFIFTALISLIVGSLLGWYIHKPQVDIMKVHDTISVDKPVFIYDTLISYEKVRVPVIVHDTMFLTDIITEHDTIYLDINIPRTQKLYKGDQYSAWVSGFHPELDSISVYNTTKVVTDNSIKLGGFGTMNFSKYPSTDIGLYMIVPKHSLDIKLGYHIQEHTSAPFLGVTYYIPFNGNKKKL